MFVEQNLVTVLVGASLNRKHIISSPGREIIREYNAESQVRSTTLLSKPIRYKVISVALTIVSKNYVEIRYPPCNL